MAASSADDIPEQLAALMGIASVRIRKTDEAPPRVSVIDVAVAVTGHDANYANQAVRNVCEEYPDVHEQNHGREISRRPWAKRAEEYPRL